MALPKTFAGGERLFAADLNAALEYLENGKIDAPSSPSNGNLLVYNSGVSEWQAQAPSSFVPTGSVFWFASGVAPTGYLKCDGAAVSRSTYSDLFNLLVTSQSFSAVEFTATTADPTVITSPAHGFVGGERLRLSTTGVLPAGLNNVTDYFVERIDDDTFYLLDAIFGTRVDATDAGTGTHSYTRSLWGLGDGSTTFNLPDLRGEFVRGWDDGRSVDANRPFASVQSDALKAHAHNVTYFTSNTTSSATLSVDAKFNSGTKTSVTSSTGGNETRPRNVAMLACIKT